MINWDVTKNWVILTFLKKQHRISAKIAIGICHWQMSLSGSVTSKSHQAQELFDQASAVFEKKASQALLECMFKGDDSQATEAEFYELEKKINSSQPDLTVKIVNTKISRHRLGRTRTWRASRT